MATQPAAGKASPSPPPTKPHDDGETVIEAAAHEVAHAFEEAGQLSSRLLLGSLTRTVAYLGEIFVLLGQTLRGLFTRGVHAGDLIRQMAVIGVESIPIALLTTGFSGAVFALYSASTLVGYGASSFVGGIVGLAITRETAPILTGVVLAARSGSAMSAEIGSMKVSEQIDALRSMAVSPIHYLVTPRLLACLIMLPLVCVLADLIGIVGGAIVGQTQGVALPTFFQSLRQFLDPNGRDVFQGLLKTIVFGAIIACVGCREGLETGGGATGVGQSTTRSVVISIVLIFLANFVLSFLMMGSVR